MHLFGAYDADASVPSGPVTFHLVHRPGLWRRNVVGQIVTCYAMARALRRIPRPDIVFLPEYVGAAVAAIVRPDLPVIFTTPGNIFEREISGNPFDWYTTQVYKVAALVAARRARHVVALSRHMRAWWIRTGARPSHVSVVPLGIDADRFRPIDSLQARSHLGIPADEEMLLFLGRLSYEKNARVLVRAMARLRSLRPRARLHIVGRGPRRKFLGDLAERLGVAERVTFTDWVPSTEVPYYYGAADLVLLPSTGEPFARVPIEAMACRATVMGSTAGGTPDAIEDRQTGYLVSPEDDEAWARTIAAALGDPEERARIAARAHRQALERYTWPTIVRRLRAEVLGPIEAEARSDARLTGADIPPIVFLDYILDLARPGASGLSDIVWDLATELDRRGVSVHVVAPYATHPRAGTGVTLHPFGLPPLGYRNIVGHALIALRAACSIPALDRAIVHAPEYMSTAVASLFTRHPVVLTVPGSIDQKISSGHNPYDPSVTAALWVAARISAARCARVVATSREMEGWWRRTGVPQNRLIRIPLGTAGAVYQRTSGARERLGLDPDRRVILTVGRLNPENDFATVLRAFAALEPTLRADLHIVGSGPEEGRLRELARDLGLVARVTFHGWSPRDRLADFYSACDAFLFAATTGGLPRVVIEAMACGAPIIATRIAGTEDVLDDGQSGVLVGIGNAAAMADQLKNLLRDPVRARRLGDAAAAEARRTLTWSGVVDRLIDEVYRPVAREHRA